MISPLMLVNPLYMNTREWRAAEVPAVNGHGTARSLARLYGALATGGTLDGAQVLKPETIEMATQTQSQGQDLVMLFPTRFGLGFILDIPDFQISPNGTTFGHFGMGGSFGIADPEAGFGVGYVMNKMMLANPETRDDPRLRGMFDAIYESV
jgi:CubicO group peptidase (beta-lactamase class C family)